jgi:hypothetical protein
MERRQLRGETTANPLAGIQRGADGYAMNAIVVAGLVALGTFPWLAHDPGFLKIMPLVSAACGLYALYLIVELALKIRRRVTWLEVDETGLAWSCRGQSFTRTWPDVAAVYRKERLVNGVALGSVRTLFRDQSELTFNRMLSHYDEIAAEIQDRSAAALRAAKEHELAAGQAEFGDVTLRPVGLDYQGRPHAWTDVDYGVVRGTLFFVPAGAAALPRNVTTEILLETIPNYSLLLELMARRGKPPVPWQGTAS